MAKKKRKITSHMRKFGTVAKAANAVCHRETNSVAGYKKCMSSNMKAGLKKSGYTGSKKKSAGASPLAKKCKGLYTSGTKKGKLKTGYTWKGRRGKTGCPVKAG